MAVILALSAQATHLAAKGGAPQTGGQPVANGIAPSAMAQIASLIAEKESRTPAQQKMDSQLVYAAKMASGQAIASGVASLQVSIPQTADKRAILDVRATVSDGLLDRLRGLGAQITETDATYHHIGAIVDLGLIETIAGMPDVVYVSPRADAMTNRRRAADQDAPVVFHVPHAGSGAPDRAALVASVKQAIDPQGPITNTGPNFTEGDVTHRAAGVFGARAVFGVDGTGVKIGVLSDGVNSLAARQTAGDLGPVTVLAGQAGSGDEGTAMLEIVHDVAPGAQLYFATAFTSVTSFAQNIRDLRTAGCDIIIDDVAYFVESPFQDGQAGSVVSPHNSGVIAQAVKDVAAGGALYFSSAANSGNLDSGTSGTWEGDFVDGGAAAAPIPEAGRLHNFGGQNYDVLTTGGRVNLSWSDPLGASANDYDLFVLNSTGTTLVTASTGVQSGTQDPYEDVGNVASGNRLVILKFGAPSVARFLHLGANRGVLSIATAGEVHGHAAVSTANTFAVAATPAAARFGGGTPGPFPGAHSGANTIEPFSSDGPRRIFYTNAGVAITPGDVSATGGQVLNKPDITAADGVSTGVAGFSPFYGTSAAAPHAGAIAALIKSKYLGLTNTQVRTILNSTAIDIHTAGWDRNSGLGIAMAYQAIASMPAPPAGPPTITASRIAGVGVRLDWTAVPSATFYILRYSFTRGGPYTTVFTGASRSVFAFYGRGTTLYFVVSAANTGGESVNSLEVGYSIPFADPANDVDGDRLSDLTVWRPSNGTFYWLTSSSAFASGANKAWGSAGDVPLSGDLDGDGKPELVVWRPSSGTFYWLTSFSGYNYANQQQKQWGGAGDKPFLADVVGDGQADLVVWRPSNGTWYWLTAASGFDYGMQGQKQFGNQALGDVPILGDFDGDHRADLAVWRGSTGTFMWLTSSSGYATTVSKQWGNLGLGDIPMVGDLDRDGISDLVVWRASTGTWYWLYSATSYSYATAGSRQWGNASLGDIPALGDLDGDGRLDLVVWRASTGTWFWLTSSSSYDYATQGTRQWGASGDIPMIK